VAVLQQVERGKVGLDDPAYQYVDPPLLRQNGTTMRELWGGNREVERITVRDLLGMTSGLNDYDDEQLAGSVFFASKAFVVHDAETHA
jgi:CubicO group peptidase (beta-lactamase class C family)